MSQSSNDTFPAAMHIAAAERVERALIPALQRSCATPSPPRPRNSLASQDRPHPPAGRCAPHPGAGVLRLGQPAGARHLRACGRCLKDSTSWPSAAPPSAPASTRIREFAERAAKKIAELTALPFRSHPNKFAALSAHDEIVFAQGALETLAASLMKIANDIRWLASGPRCGLGELTIPENEPGSSIMPGKVNPTQCEAMTMVGGAGARRHRRRRLRRLRRATSSSTSSSRS